MKKMTLWILCILLCSSVYSQEAPDSILKRDPAMVPPVITSKFDAKYKMKNLKYGMSIGIERTSKGRVWACWVAGGDDQDAFFCLSYSDSQGKKWSDVKYVLDPHSDTLPLARRTLVGNLWRDPQGRLWLFFDQAMTYFDGRGGSWYSICDDPDAKNPVWSKPVRIWHGVSLQKPTVLQDGSWVLPVSLWTREKIRLYGEHQWNRHPYKEAYRELDSLRAAHVFVSKDQGKHWERRGGVVFPSQTFDEHMIVELKDGRLWMTARTGKHGIQQSFSSDGGYTWTAPEKYLNNQSARHFIRRLSSGNLLLVKHGKINERTKKRSHLTAYISTDDGKSWQGGLVLDERVGVSYPDGFEAPDGMIYIAYDYNRAKNGDYLLAKFTEQDVLRMKIVSPEGVLEQLISSPGSVHLSEKAK